MRVTITNVFGSGNRGDAALVSSLCASIRRSFASAEIHGFTNFPEKEASFLPGVKWHEAPGYAQRGPFQRVANAILLGICAGLMLLGFPRWLTALLPRSQVSAIRALRQSDLAVSCPGGFLLDVNLRFIADLLQLQLVVSSRVPLIIAPQTIGPIRNRFLRAWAARVLSKAEVIFIREEISRAYLKDELNLEKNVAFFPDLAFLHTERSVHEAAIVLREKQLAGKDFLAVSVVDWHFPELPDRARAQAEYEDKLARAISAVQGQTGLPVLIINQVSSDLDAARRVAGKCPGLTIVDEEERPPEVLRGILWHANAMVASRFHSCIFSLLENTPVTAIAYNYKTDGIMRWLDMSDHVLDIRTFSSSELHLRILKSLETREANLLEKIEQEQLIADWDRTIQTLAGAISQGPARSSARRVAAS